MSVILLSQNKVTNRYIGRYNYNYLLKYLKIRYDNFNILYKTYFAILILINNYCNLILHFYLIYCHFKFLLRISNYILITILNINSK